MTQDEAVKVCGIIEYADGGCISCVTNMFESFRTAFPELDWEAAFRLGAKGDDHYWTHDEIIKRAACS